MLSIVTVAVYIILLVMLCILDYKYRIISNKLIYPGIAGVLALSWFGMGIIPSLIGGGIGLLIMLVPLLFKAKVGMGDIKLGLLIGLMVGYPLIVVNILVSGVLSIILCVWLVATKRKKFGDLVPYGSLLCVATIITILKGYDLWMLITKGTTS